MTRPDLWHDPGRLLTVDDLAELPPGDDRRYELDDGMLIVGVGINITKFQHREPNVAVVPADSFSVDYIEHPPALVVEVSSPSTRLYDRNRKKDVYEGFGVPA